jgi:hypothetical protein
MAKRVKEGEGSNQAKEARLLLGGETGVCIEGWRSTSTIENEAQSEEGTRERHAHGYGQLGDER